jgi:predicted house-cleaning noncanonical NTP pyrophosphatase (MazG superfamily)
MKVYHNKLVRDKILDILKKKKVKFEFHVAKEEEFLNRLYEKLIEEINEFKEKPSVDEFADIMEVLESIAREHDFQLEEIKIAKKTKKMNRGGFNKKIVLDFTD